MQVTRRTVDGVLAAAIAATKILVPTAVFVQPYAVGPINTPPAVAADFGFPTVAALAPVAVGAWGAVQYLLDGRSCIAGPAITFAVAGPADAITVLGFALGDDSVMTNILAWEPFVTPINLLDQHHPLTIIPRICLDPAGPWGADVIIDG